MKSLSPDGLYLIEIDRVLRPGGYWILSGPPIRWKKYYKGWERTQEDLKQEQDLIEDVESAFAGRRSSRKVILQSGKSPWTTLNASKAERSMKNHTHARVTTQMLLGMLSTAICMLESSSSSPNSKANTWNFVVIRYKNMETCIIPLPEVSNSGEVAGGGLEKWPERAFAVPPTISRGTVPGVTVEKFQEDNLMWEERIAYYKRIIPPLTRTVPECDGHECQIGGIHSIIGKVFGVGNECGSIWFRQRHTWSYLWAGSLAHIKIGVRLSRHIQGRMISYMLMVCSAFIWMGNRSVPLIFSFCSFVFYANLRVRYFIFKRFF